MQYLHELNLIEWVGPGGASGGLAKLGFCILGINALCPSYLCKIFSFMAWANVISIVLRRDFWLQFREVCLLGATHN